jgi:hypothetical protein
VSLPSWLNRERLWIAGLLLFTALVRGGVLWAMRENLQQDPDLYREIAENVLQYGVYGRGREGPPTPTAYRPPLYPIALTNLQTTDGEHVSLWKVAVFHLLLGMGTVWLTYATASRLSSPTFHVGQIGGQTSTSAGESATGQRRWYCLAHTECGPTLAALLVACDPILLNQQTLLMTETLATLLAILALWCLVRFSNHRYWWNAALAGGAIGLAALCRPTFLPWLGLVGLAMLISDFGFRISDLRRWFRRALPNFVALSVAAAAVMSPWVIRNQREFGKPILTTTHGGYTLALGNNGEFYQWLQRDVDGPWESDVFDFKLQFFAMLRAYRPPLSYRDADSPAGELSRDAFAYDYAHDAMHENPTMVAVAALYRVGQLWSPMPHKLTADDSTSRRALRYPTAVWYCSVYVLAAVGAWRLRRRLFRQPWVWGVLLCLAFTAVHTLYWSNLRMRAPLMPFVALVAAAGVMTGKLGTGK